MHTEEEDKIVKTIKNVCKDLESAEGYFATLKDIYDHISKHENEPSDSMAKSIKNIIDSRWEE